MLFCAWETSGLVLAGKSRENHEGGMARTRVMSPSSPEKKKKKHPPLLVDFVVIEWHDPAACVKRRTSDFRLPSFAPRQMNVHVCFYFLSEKKEKEK